MSALHIAHDLIHMASSPNAEMCWSSNEQVGCQKRVRPQGQAMPRLEMHREEAIEIARPSVFVAFTEQRSAISSPGCWPKGRGGKVRAKTCYERSGESPLTGVGEFP